MLALDIQNLCKTYAGGVQALRNLNLQVKEGEFVGLLGPNGAGKTTTINTLASLVAKTSGSVKVCGYDLDSNVREVKRSLGLVPQEFNFQIFEKVEDIVTTQGGFFGLSLRQSRQRCHKLLKELGLWDKRAVPGRFLSGGMKRRLLIARGLIHRPKVLILDEPTAGVDIDLRRTLWRYLKKINDEGITIILTTHYLEEAESLCDRIAIINQGRIVEDDSKLNLLEKLRCVSFTLDVERSAAELPESDRFHLKQQENGQVELAMNRDHSLNDAFDFLSQHGISVRGMRNTTNRLEEIFVDITKEDGK